MDDDIRRKQQFVDRAIAFEEKVKDLVIEHFQRNENDMRGYRGSSAVAVAAMSHVLASIILASRADDPQIEKQEQSMLKAVAFNMLKKALKDIKDVSLDGNVH